MSCEFKDLILCICCGWFKAGCRGAVSMGPQPPTHLHAQEGADAEQPLAQAALRHADLRGGGGGGGGDEPGSGSS